MALCSLEEQRCSCSLCNSQRAMLIRMIQARRSCRPRRCEEGGRSSPALPRGGAKRTPSKRNRERRTRRAVGRETEIYNLSTFRRERVTSAPTGRSPRVLSRTDCCSRAMDPVIGPMLLRKEVIQPHLPVRLPCYDFTPIAGPTFDSSLLAVGPLASGVTNFRGVTGGVYKARERIHPGVADPGLLATPASRSRVADSDPN